MDKTTYSFFPGCSLKASGHENTDSLFKFCEMVGIELIELDDWNCCGSSSAHSINHEVARNLPLRNLSLAPKGYPLLIACPSCLIRLKQSYLKLKNDPDLQEKYRQDWGTSFDPNLEIIHFFELFKRVRLTDYIKNLEKRLKGIKVAPYYGCMLSMPPDLRREPSHYGLMEEVLASLGADVISHGYETQCCGTYLSVAKPELAEKVVTQIISRAMDAGAECLVTACAMCHLNLEIRCALKNPIPAFHFSELLSMALGAENQKKWFPKHIVDPIPLLKERGLLKS
jgi:heterodisulfide reductase subunit B